MKKLVTFLFVMVIALTAIPVTRADAATIKISKSKATLEVDATLQLKISGSESSVKWISSKESTATVSKKGLVTAVKAGQATITATISNKKYSCDVTVVDSNKQPLLNIEPFEIMLKQGEYKIGIDVPSGKCSLKGIDGWGMVYIYSSEEKLENDDYEKVILLCGGESAETLSSMYAEVYNNLRLKEGQYIKIEQTLQVQFKR